VVKAHKEQLDLLVLPLLAQEALKAIPDLIALLDHKAQLDLQVTKARKVVKAL